MAELGLDRQRHWDHDVVEKYWDKFFYIKSHINIAIGSEQEFDADGVLYAHNALFDETTPVMAYLFLLEWFEKKYKTPAELFADLSAEIKLNPAFTETPFFLEAVPSGREFVSPPVAAMARSASDALRYWAGESGLLDGSAPLSRDPTHIKHWAESLAKAQLTVVALDDDVMDEETKANQDRLYSFLDRIMGTTPAPDISRYKGTEQVSTGKGTSKGMGIEREAETRHQGKEREVKKQANDDEDDEACQGPAVAEINEPDSAVLAARAYEKYRVSGDVDKEEEGYRCPWCALYTHQDPVPAAILLSISKFETHVLFNHSEWKDLELKMATVAKHCHQHSLDHELLKLSQHHHSL
ncbi:hypothetical protein B0H19DRAFT_1267799 [Mycena capillaripes]|nr:hypothetical protein B0H19DRAFT_1267799 [Mycena capillaripes]